MSHSESSSWRRNDKLYINIKTIDDFKNLLSIFFQSVDVEIYLFGSRAKETNSEFSDIDIGILSKKDIKNKILLLKEILEESNLPYKVDIVYLNNNPKFKKIAIKEGIRWV
jgi:predicted nucleotidyltransferase